MSNNQVLVPLNQSDLSQKIFPYVEKFISPDLNDLIIFYVTNPPSAVGFGEPDLGAGYVQMPGDVPVKPTMHPIFATQQQDSIKAHVESELLAVTNRLSDAGYSVKIVVSFDKDPLNAILQEIASSNIDLVAMSSKGRVGVTRFFFSNIANTLTQKTGIPVLLTPPG